MCSIIGNSDSCYATDVKQHGVPCSDAQLCHRQRAVNQQNGLSELSRSEQNMAGTCITLHRRKVDAVYAYRCIAASFSRKACSYTRG